jgi:hypothetical protein
LSKPCENARSLSIVPNQAIWPTTSARSTDWGSDLGHCRERYFAHSGSRPPEAQSRGYLSHVLAEFSDGRLFPLFFYDIDRLKQDLDANIRRGHSFIADAGMIVVPEITLEIMEQAVIQASKEGFFDHLSEISTIDLASNCYQWPPTRVAKNVQGTAGDSETISARA